MNLTSKYFYAINTIAAHSPIFVHFTWKITFMFGQSFIALNGRFNCCCCCFFPIILWFISGYIRIYNANILFYRFDVCSNLSIYQMWWHKLISWRARMHCRQRQQLHQKQKEKTKIKQIPWTNYEKSKIK